VPDRDRLAHWNEETRSAWLYRALAEVEPPGPARDLFAKLAAEADRQADRWRAKLEAPPPPFAPDSVARAIVALARVLGLRRIRPVLAAAKVRGLSALGASPGHPLPATVGDVGKRHRATAAAGNLRAAVFGASDGLVSNASLVLGFAGAAADDRALLLAGVAGLLAGASSMAAGEYVSVRSQREMTERQLATERDELAEYPDAEAAELALIYQARGMPEDDAEAFAKRLVARPDIALETLAREELGVDPHELVSPYAAAASSFLAFAVGAAVPLLPLLALPGPAAVGASVATTAAALFGVGALTSIFTGAGALRSGARMLALGALAGGITWAAGRLLGVAIG
jgi:VIT1/CCC1 family predicted Fe2+/Mn2+ transporter